jgi:hypothetical protein
MANSFNPRDHLIQLPRRTKDRTTGQYVTQYDDYLEVKWRVVMFRERYPHGSIITEEICVDLDKGYARYKAHVGDGDGGMATGYGTETVKDFADFAERAETRAVGRALALLGFGTQFVGTDLTEGDHVADAPVAPPQIPVDELPASPEHPSQEQIDYLFQVAESCREPKDAFGSQLRRIMGLDGSVRITKKFLREAMTMNQLASAEAHYTAILKASVEEDVPNHPPPGRPEQEMAQAPFASSSAPDAEPSAPEPMVAEDPADQDRAIARALALSWGLPEAEVDHVLSHHRDPEKARNILWKAKQQREHKPEPQPSLAAAD